MNIPTPNLPLLRKVLDHIDAHPEEWHQDLYALDAKDLESLGYKVPECGTAFCVAGHAVNMTVGVEYTNYGLRPADGGGFGETAMDQLGITVSEAARLFAGSNTREDVQRAAEQIAARAGERL